MQIPGIWHTESGAHHIPLTCRLCYHERRPCFYSSTVCSLRHRGSLEMSRNPMAVSLLHRIVDADPHDLLSLPFQQLPALALIEMKIWPLQYGSDIESLRTLLDNEIIERLTGIANFLRCNEPCLRSQHGSPALRGFQSPDEKKSVATLGLW